MRPGDAVFQTESLTAANDRHMFGISVPRRRAALNKNGASSSGERMTAQFGPNSPCPPQPRPARLRLVPASGLNTGGHALSAAA